MKLRTAHFTDSGNKSSCLIPASTRKRAAVFLALLTVGGITGALLGHTAVGLVFGVLLGMPAAGVG